MTTQSEERPGKAQSVQQIRDQMAQELVQTRQFKDQITGKIFNLQIENINNRLNYHKHITTIVVAILGFTIVMISQPEKIIFSYLLTGTIIFSVLLILILSNIRESLDHDSSGLTAQHQEYMEIMGKKEEILIKHMQSDRQSRLGFLSNRD